MSVEIIWFGDRWYREWQERYTNRMRRVLVRLEAYCKGLMRISSEEGKNPSKPGNPPHVLFGHLRGTIGHNWEWVSDVLYGYLGVLRGPAERYGGALELGAPSRNLLPRPYLDPTIHNNRQLIIRMLTR